VFGFSFGELIVLVIVAIVVIGPKDLPRVLRQMGRWAAKLRRMASDMRAQSGIDEVLRTEGLAQDIAEIRKLARGELDNVNRELGRLDQKPPPVTPWEPGPTIEREREHPAIGPDAYGALPDTAIVYAEALPPSQLVRDDVYMQGDPPPPCTPLSHPEEPAAAPITENAAEGAAEGRDPA
jgi:sec-independent protein translocase protein TatB